MRLSYPCGLQKFFDRDRTPFGFLAVGAAQEQEPPLDFDACVFCQDGRDDIKMGEIAMNKNPGFTEWTAHSRAQDLVAEAKDQIRDLKKSKKPAQKAVSDADKAVGEAEKQRRAVGPLVAAFFEPAPLPLRGATAPGEGCRARHRAPSERATLAATAGAAAACTADSSLGL